MTGPKRHHWWPQLQSKYWCDAAGKINVIERDGSLFQTTPTNIGVEGNLYTFLDNFEQPSTEIESWLAEEIDGPFDEIFGSVFDFRNTRRIFGSGDPAQAARVAQVGYRLKNYAEYLNVDEASRKTICRYVASLLVRNPIYIEKLMKFHQRENLMTEAPVAKRAALDNMLYVFEIYENALSDATIGVIRRDAENEFIFPDGGILVSEPWGKGLLPFDLHVPMTPDIALAVLPLNGMRRAADFFVSDASNRAISHHNRIALSAARRFVFTRGRPPMQFIQSNFGRAAPKQHGIRLHNGRIETTINESLS